GGNFIVYALSVPNQEFLGLGPLFELGAFNPEGCASTAAGLGDPGKLVITNGSTIPKKFDPVAGTISNVSIQPPFPDELPATLVEDDSASPDGGLSTGIYVYRYTLRNSCTGHESDPNDTDIEVDTTGASPAAKVTLSFAGVRIPGDGQIDQLCIYRTVAGGAYPAMAKLGCLDLSAGESIYVDTAGDAVLDFTNEGLSLLNGVMPCVPIVVEFRNFLFGMGDIPILSPAGTVSVVEGSDIIEGSLNVEWDRCLINKFIHIQGDCRRYEIKAILPPAAGTSPPIQRLQLYDVYEGTNDTGLLYTICGRPNRLYNSEPLEPESWPAISFIDIEPGDGDRLMGAVANFDRLVICKRRKTYVLTFRSTPAAEVIVPARISSDIGCIAHRSFAQVESGSVWLADRGLAIYDGRGVSHVPASEQMNDIFTDPNNARYVRRDAQGRVVDAVGVFYPKREQYLLILPSVRSQRGCDMMLVWDVKLQNVTLLEFCQEFQSMVVGKDSEGNQRVYLGDTNGFVWMFDIGLTDGVGYPNATGTVRGTITAAGTTADGVSYIDDEEASFLLGGLPELAGLSGVAGLSGAFGGLSPQENDLGLAGACVHWRAADAGKDDDWSSMFVFAASESRLYLAVPFSDDTPAVGDDYMIGAIRFDCTFKPANMGTDDFMKRNWRQVLTHVPQDRSGKLRVELRPDFMPTDPE
ncbi:MAG TPA: hypothetical protein VMW94_00755, partial [Actinomycetes bacterium]|nr:hypothetical protein [Actinomycetes bacterium]